MTVTPDPTSAIRAQWDAAAEGWDAQAPAVRAWLGAPTELMFAMAGIMAGQTVLDVAAGAGDGTLDLAGRVGATGRVVATDLSPALVDRLRANVGRAGATNVTAREADAQEPVAEAAFFDAAVCRLGLMLMPDPRRAVRATVAALRPGAGFAAMVFAGPEANPCLRILMATALKHAGLPPRDPFTPGSLFSLGRPGALDSLFRWAGLSQVAVARVEAPFRLASAGAYVAFARAAAAPVHAVLAGLDPMTRERAWTEMEAELGRFAGPEGWIGPNTLLIVAGRR